MDWSGDLYGRRVRVEFVHRLRDIPPFTSVDALIEAMKEDAAGAGGTRFVDIPLITFNRATTFSVPHFHPYS